MISFSYHFTNVQDSFSSSSSYQQALKFLVLVIVLVQLIVNFLEYSKVMSYVQSEYQWNTHLYTNLPNHPFISIAHKESSISMQNILYMQSDPL